MPNYTQASLSDVYAAGIVRGAEFGAALRDEMRQRVPDLGKVREWNLRILNLRFGLQQAALTSDPAKRDEVLGYLQETYGLLSLAQELLLRPNKPPLSPVGNMLVPVWLSVNGFLVVVNGKYIRLRYVLVPKVPPVFGTSLLPGQFAGLLTFDGLAGTVFSFDGPVPNAGPVVRLRLFVGYVRVGTINFPLGLINQGFSLLYLGQLYYGVFQQTASNDLAL